MNVRLTGRWLAVIILAAGLVVASAPAAMAACGDPPGPNVDWSGCDKSGQDFSNEDFSFANLSNANLTGTSFANATMMAVNLSGANLTGANLNNASMGGADLTDATITDANIANADLTGADLTGITGLPINFDSAIFDDTTCPSGSNSDDHGGTCWGPNSLALAGLSAGTALSVVPLGLSVAAVALGGLALRRRRAG